jgi:regulator of protease activity HflC (stomatin/prohibitin superfamily)
VREFLVGLFTFIAGVIVVGLGLIVFVGALVFGQPARPAQWSEATPTRVGYPPRERVKVADATTSTRVGGVLLGLILLTIGGVTVVLDSFTTVQSRGVAVQTAFGKVRGDTLGPGFHWVRPWINIEEFDGSVQTLKYYKDEKADDGSCLTVRLGNSTQACVDVTSQWNINYRGDVKDLYLAYRTFDNIHDNLVRRQLGSALNEVFGTYDPLAVLSSADGQVAVNTVTLQAQVLTVLQRDLGSAIRIDSVTVPIVHFDVDTENRLKAFQQAKADTRIATQNTLTAQQQALANQALANQQAVTNPGVMYQNCLNLIDRLSQKGQLSGLPPTFNCNQTGAAGTLIQTK